MEDDGSATRRMALLDEIDRLERENLSRRPATVTLGAFVFSFIQALAGPSLVWGGAAVAFFVAFLGLMVRPIKRFQRIHALRAEVALLDQPQGHTPLPPGKPAL